MFRSTIGSALFAWIACAACARPPAVVDPFAPRAVAEKACWRVSHDGAPIGRVALLEIDDPGGPIRMYRAENAVGQWLGYLDANLGVYQRVPFQEREVFRGIYPMEKGLALLYEVSGPVELTPAETSEAAEAAVRFPPREDR